MNELYKKFKDMDQHNLDLHFCSYCARGDLDIIKYLLYSPKLKNHANIDSKKNKGFLFACQNGHLEVVKFLLGEQKITPIDIHTEDDSALYSAINGGHLHIIKYLLESPNLLEHADPLISDYIVRALASEGRLNIIKYFLEETAKKLDVHIYDDTIFRISFAKQNTEVLEYLILNFNIDKNLVITNIIKSNDNDFGKYIGNMFDSREIKKELNDKLLYNNESTKKLKL